MSKDHLVIFDFDGVIVNTLEMSAEINKVHNPDVDREEWLSHFEGNIFDRMELKKKAHLTPEEEKRERWSWEEYEKQLEYHRPEEKMPEVIQNLGKHYSMVIVSSSYSEIIKKFLESHGLSSYFQTILGSDVHKSKVVKIRTALQQNNILAQNTIMITDTLGDIKEADQCNVAAIAVAWGYHTIETLKKGNPYAIITDPDELVPAIKGYFVKVEK